MTSQIDSGIATRASRLGRRDHVPSTFYALAPILLSRLAPTLDSNLNGSMTISSNHPTSDHATDDHRAQAAMKFAERFPQQDGSRVANRLSQGLRSLRRGFFARLQHEAEACGNDSMLIPASIKGLRRMEASTKLEIEIYQIAVSTEEVKDRGYVDEAPWYCDWLTRLRLGTLADRGHVTERLDHYLAEARSERRLEFGDVLARTTPAATKVPLVLYRLFPLSIRIATNLAFDDHLSAAEMCNQRNSILPLIESCHECHGRPMANGTWCETCGNPVWETDWLRNAE
ncbi:MAG: hypothetical protein DWQ35_11175 [Planctomycetota bacterium]|nr:MAG: hypothetical protein DWQ35_11175 [Planctomycetota bacterium]REK17351.1 MAG: hypothetical protein DWQ42_22465 [Planctomycetota bacterium]REK46026.1 MAG: hypothetical protein DWQ46_07635 [Planctomycetota bacterium]